MICQIAVKFTLLLSHRLQEPVDRYSHVSGSSIDSKRRQLERSSTEYFEEPPHLIEVMTTPDHSPDASPRPVVRYQHQYRDYHHDFDNQHFTQHYMEDEDVVDGDFIVQTERRTHQQQRRSDHRSDRSTHSGREEMYSVAETEVSGWARKH